LSVAEARAAIGAGELSAVELLDSVLDRARARNDELRAYLLIDDDGARATARAADRAARAGDSRPLLGIPICVKDMLDVAGMPTAASAAGWRRDPKHDAAAVAKIRAAGAVIVGKGNTNEFAYGIDGRNPHWGDARNPHDPSRISGGSSSGPAVAVASGMALAGLGTDTSGSIRVPAALCGLVGLRPTHGAIPTEGVVPLAPTYDVVGTLAKTVEDTAVLWRVLNGPGAPRNREPGIRLWSPATAQLEPAIARAIRELAELLHAEPIELPLLDRADPIHTTIQRAEASAVHAGWFEEQRERYTPQVRERLEVGNAALAVDYINATSARRELAHDFARRLDDNQIQAVLAPTTPFVAPPLDGDPDEQRVKLLAMTLPLTQTGGPVLAIPAGEDDAGLPFGVQLAGAPGDELTLLELAGQLDPSRATP
jgi:aspartyl-tRNA(Asn)/glutamyl-tRNA(Gln) amidotransferase subunit A